LTSAVYLKARAGTRIKTFSLSYIYHWISCDIRGWGRAMGANNSNNVDNCVRDVVLNTFKHISTYIV